MSLMLEMLCRVLILLIVFGRSRSPATDDCVYPGNMKDVSLEKCISPMLIDDIFFTCSYMGYPDLYASRGEVEFWVNISSHRYYAHNLTFAVYRVTEDDEISKVESCASFNLHSSCKLPPTNGTWYFTVAPYKGKGKYCIKWIQEYPAFYPEWCSIDSERPCIYLDNGVLKVKEKFVPSPEVRPDFLFFNIPKDHFKDVPSVDTDGLIKNVTGVTVNDTSVYVGGEPVSHHTKLQTTSFNLTEFLTTERNAQCEFSCAFFRMKRFDIEWSDPPFCYGLGACTPIGIPPYVIAIALILLLIIAGIGLSIWMKNRRGKKSAGSPTPEKGVLLDSKSTISSNSTKSSSDCSSSDDVYLSKQDDV